MTNDDLRQVGELLYGPRWQSDLARDLGVAGRTVRRWVAGDAEISDDVAGRLADQVADRLRRLTDLAERLGRGHTTKPRGD